MKSLLKQTPQSLYWLGFLIADGYFSFSHSRIELTLSKKDEEHFNLFKLYFNCSYSDEREFTGTIHNNKTITKSSLLRTYTKSNKLDFNTIIETYSIKPKKSETPPDIDFLINLSEDLFCCFLVGFIDGDGWKETGGSGGSSYHVIACHKNYLSFLSYLTERLNLILNIKSRPAHIKASKQQAVVSLSPKKSSYLKHIIMTHNLIHLNRKWNNILPIQLHDSV